MHVALTGASGFIGSVTARRLHAAGHTVAALVRPTSRRDHIEEAVDRFVIGAHSDPDACADLLTNADVLIHNSLDWDVRTTDDGQRNLIDSLRLLDQSAPRRYVFVSSVAVHHDISPRWQGLIDEEHPLRPANDYGAYKAAVEAFLWADHYSKGREVVSVRPCAVYGMDPRPDRTLGYRLVETLLAGNTPTRQRDGRHIHGKFVHVDDVADALLAAATRPDIPPRPYNLVDCYARWTDWAAIAADELGLQLDLDMSDPPHPQNHFNVDAARRDLAVPLDRGREGIRAHIRNLIAHLRA